MKKIKLTLSPEQQRVLGGMLRCVVMTEEVRRVFPTEYFVLMEWYHRQAARFLFVNNKPFMLLPSQACALWRLMSEPLWVSPSTEVATAILWELDRYFVGRLRIN